MLSLLAASCWVGLASLASAQASCSTSVAAKYPAPSVAPGYQARLVASNLTKPRGLTFDSQGHLLVVEQQSGVVALTLHDDGGTCVTEASRKVVSNDTSLNHGITLDSAGTTLYASSAEAVHMYPYNAMNASIGKDTVIVSNMTTDDHTTRTLLLSRKVNNTLVVTRGSTSNIDPEAEDMASGHSQIKSFNLSALPSDRPFNFNTDGTMLGWGLRNDVGIAEEPSMGGLYAVENSADQIMRNGMDIHQNNPAEKLNFLGYLRPPAGVAQSRNQGANFGYPTCFAAWMPAEIPSFGGTTGQQFAIGTTNATNNDTACGAQYAAPRLSFLAHMAPLDIKFNSAGSTAWITFHGSWDRSDPSGYKVGAVNFANGEPTANSSSNTALVDIVSNQNNNADCPDKCFRPVAMAWDSMGRLFFSSDATGEVYVVTKASSSGTGTGVDSATPAAASSSSSTAPAATSPSPSSSAAPKLASQFPGLAVMTALLAVAFVLS